ncbi:MAG: TIGR01777 family oxidoreductase [Anaerolineaceae bacterium]|nr:MAG: TIGR01777 family oxidoreductase [Anaerolineaceae bacterium]
MKRVVVSGGTGLIGRDLVARLTAGGYEIVVLSRNPQKYRSALPQGVSAVFWDARTVGEWAQMVDGSDVVINLAGESLSGDGFLPDRWTAEKKRHIRDSRVFAGSAIVEAIKMAGKKPEVLIQASAVGYYGPRAGEWVDESEEPGNDFLAALCVEWETVTEPVEAMGVRRAISRLGLVLSNDGGALPRLLLPAKLFAGGYFGNGRQYWPWIHIDDAIRALRFLMENGSAKGPFNLVAPHPATSREFGQALGRALSRPSIMPVPSFAMRLLAGEAATTVLDGQRAAPRKLDELGFVFRFPELDAALLDLARDGA